MNFMAARALLRVSDRKGEMEGVPGGAPCMEREP
jgi:hypothetical protein